MSGNPIRPNLSPFVNRMQTPAGSPWWNPGQNPQQRMDFRGLPPNMAPPGAPFGLLPGTSTPAGFDPGNALMQGQGFSGIPQPQQRQPQQEQPPSSQFSKDVQDEANGYFQQLYSETGNMTVNQFLDKLKTFKNSESQKDQDVLACVLKNLFDEYRFFHEYPERALRITAEVYGGIIRESLLPNMMQLATAVRRIIQALGTKEHSQPLYTFGVLALFTCKATLYHYPKLCQIILGIECFQQFAPTMKEYIQYGAQRQLPPNHSTIEQREAAAPSPWPMTGGPQPPLPAAGMSGGMPQPQMGGGPIGIRGMTPGVIPGMGMPPLGTTPPTTHGPSPSPIKFIQTQPGRSSSSMLNATNVDVLMNATDREGSRVPQPPPLVVEKVAFLCNNLSQVNLRQKTEEIKDLMRECGDDFLRWFAQYLVMKRVTLEQNFQPLYNSFLLSINDDGLDRYVKQETFRNIKILLRSDKGNAASNFGDRQLLKNLGLWLGQITIARNKPVLARDLDLKCLLFEAFYKGQQELLYVIPFVAKTLLSCTKSELFQPMCAWIFAIIKVLAEIHNEPDLKLNLKFEIEVLCKDLGIDLSQIEPTGVLKDTERLVRVPQQLGELVSLVQPKTGQAGQLGASLGIAPPIDPGRVSGRTSANLMPPSAITPTHELTAAEQAKQGVAIQPPSIFLSSSFSYNDINVASLDGLAQHISLPQMPLFQIHPELRAAVRPAINQAVKELIGAITERAISVAIAVTEQVCKKDFALDPNPQHLRRGAQQMARSMTAAMAWITCREPLQNTILGYLRHYITTHLQQAASNPEISKMIEDTVTSTMEANIDLATNFIVKTACEQAMAEVDKRFATELMSREKAAKEFKVFGADSQGYKIQQQMPDAIRINLGHIAEEQMKIYDDYNSKICGFKPSQAPSTFNQAQFANQLIGNRLPSSLDPPLFAGNQANRMGSSTPTMGLNVSAQPFSIQPIDQNALLAQTIYPPPVLVQVQPPQQYESGQWYTSTQAPMAPPNFNQAQFASQLAAGSRMPSNLDPASLLASRLSSQTPTMGIDVSQQQQAYGAPPVVSAHDQNALLVQTLYPPPSLTQIQSQQSQPFQPTQWYPVSTAQPSLASQNFNQAQFASQLTSGRVPSNLDSNLFGSTSSRLGNTTPTLGPDVSQAYIEQLRATSIASRPPTNSTPMAVSTAGGLTPLEQTSNLDQLRSKVEAIVREWMAICFSPVTQQDPRRALAHIVQSMHREGILMTDETVTKFFQIYVNICVDVTHRLLNSDQPGGQISVRHRCYLTLDAFTKLTCLMVRYSDGPQNSTRINLLKKVLNIITAALHQNHEYRKAEFDGMPFMRIILNLFSNLARANDPQLEPISWNVLECFGHALFVCQPRRAPGFTYHWLTIIGHRDFIGRLLAEETKDPHRTGAMYTQLLLCHMKFMAPYLRNLPLPMSVQVLLKGTLRVLLVILHDFPELLCEYHYVFCDYIPPDCIQLRNLILSAYPRSMRLPDPFNEAMETIENLPEMAQNPKAHRDMSNIIQTIQANNPESIQTLKTKLDEYLETRSTVNFLSELPSYLQVSQVPGSKYNSSLMSAIVLYVGTKAIDALQANKQKISIQTVAHTSFMDIFQNLAVSLCTEGRHLLFNSIANQLRYPNSHTHYFSCTMLYLFLEANLEVIQEQITRILFQRLVALRPHPWGLLITFVELIRNPQYGFWKHEFIRCAPEIEQLFVSVANSCNVNPQQILTQQSNNGQMVKRV